MDLSAIARPKSDPTPIFEHFRGNYGSELLTIAVAHFDIFGRLSRKRLSLDALRRELQLKSRPMIVLVTALRAMGLLVESDGLLSLSDRAKEHLVPGGDFDCGDYIGLAAQSPGVLAMLHLLKTNKPLGSDETGGTAFIFRDGIESAMEGEESARHFTMALAGRAKNVAPALAAVVPLKDSQWLLDVGGGTGIYSYAMLRKNPHLRAIIFDRPEVLKVAEEMARTYGVRDRVELLPGDMFADELPAGADVILLSNVLHDWDIPQCQQIVRQCGDVLEPGQRLLIHDVFLHDNLDGPLPIALYSASLFSFTEGRAYSGAEYRGWLEEAGMSAGPIVPTMVHCGVLSAEKK
jgi:ubiquinone/menaquinone biosynthesis C-methylase UbiE